MLQPNELNRLPKIKQSPQLKKPCGGMWQLSAEPDGLRRTATMNSLRSQEVGKQILSACILHFT